MYEWYRNKRKHNQRIANYVEVDNMHYRNCEHCRQASISLANTSGKGRRFVNSIDASRFFAVNGFGGGSHNA